jgi:hypothetical protein
MLVCSGTRLTTLLKFDNTDDVRHLTIERHARSGAA